MKIQDQMESFAGELERIKDEKSKAMQRRTQLLEQTLQTHEQHLSHLRAVRNHIRHMDEDPDEFVELDEADVDVLRSNLQEYLEENPELSVLCGVEVYEPFIGLVDFPDEEDAEDDEDEMDGEDADVSDMESESNIISNTDDNSQTLNDDESVISSATPSELLSRVSSSLPSRANSIPPQMRPAPPVVLTPLIGLTSNMGNSNNSGPPGLSPVSTPPVRSQWGSGALAQNLSKQSVFSNIPNIVNNNINLNNPNIITPLLSNTSNTNAVNNNNTTGASLPTLLEAYGGAVGLAINSSTPISNAQATVITVNTNISNVGTPNVPSSANILTSSSESMSKANFIASPLPDEPQQSVPPPPSFAAPSPPVLPSVMVSHLKPRPLGPSGLALLESAERLSSQFTPIASSVREKYHQLMNTPHITKLLKDILVYRMQQQQQQQQAPPSTATITTTASTAVNPTTAQSAKVAISVTTTTTATKQISTSSVSAPPSNAKAPALPTSSLSRPPGLPSTLTQPITDSLLESPAAPPGVSPSAPLTDLPLLPDSATPTSKSAQPSSATSVIKHSATGTEAAVSPLRPISLAHNQSTTPINTNKQSFATPAVEVPAPLPSISVVTAVKSVEPTTSVESVNAATTTPPVATTAAAPVTNISTTPAMPAVGFFKQLAQHRSSPSEMPPSSVNGPLGSLAAGLPSLPVHSSAIGNVIASIAAAPVPISHLQHTAPTSHLHAPNTITGPVNSLLVGHAAANSLYASSQDVNAAKRVFAYSALSWSFHPSLCSNDGDDAYWRFRAKVRIGWCPPSSSPAATCDPSLNNSGTAVASNLNINNSPPIFLPLVAGEEVEVRARCEVTGWAYGSISTLQSSSNSLLVSSKQQSNELLKNRPSMGWFPLSLLSLPPFSPVIWRGRRRELMAATRVKKTNEAAATTAGK